MQLTLNPTAVRASLPFGTWSLRGAAITYLAVMIALPVVVIAVEGLRPGVDSFWTNITRPAALSAIVLTVWTAAVMGVINAIMGTLTAYVLIAYRFPGKRLLDSLIDLPFSIPTLVTGIMLILLYGPQTPVGSFFNQTLGIDIIFGHPGIILALLFIGYPFVIRAVQPILLHMDSNQQEAAYTLGASDWTTFRRVVLPLILPAMVTGGLLSFARALGEFGAMVIVSGNLPMRTQTAAVYIYGQVEGGNIPAASSISLVMLIIALATTLLANVLLKRSQRYG